MLTPFLGIGSEVYGAVAAGRKGIGFELKSSYFSQATRNIAALDNRQDSIFDVANDNHEVVVDAA